MLELSHAIRHPSESKNNVPSISDTVKTLLFFSFFFLYIYRGTVFLSVRSRSSETRPELRSPGERSRAFLGAGRQTVLLCQLQVHRERQGSRCWRGVLSTSDFFFSSKVSEVTENTCSTDVDFCLCVFFIVRVIRSVMTWAQESSR